MKKIIRFVLPSIAVVILLTGIVFIFRTEDRYFRFNCKSYNLYWQYKGINIDDEKRYIYIWYEKREDNLFKNKRKQDFYEILDEAYSSCIQYIYTVDDGKYNDYCVHFVVGGMKIIRKSANDEYVDYISNYAQRIDNVSQIFTKVDNLTIDHPIYEDISEFDQFEDIKRIYWKSEDSQEDDIFTEEDDQYIISKFPNCEIDKSDIYDWY